MTEKMEMIAGNLQERIGQLVAQYEANLASLRADATEQIQTLAQENARLQKELDEATQKSEATTSKA